MSFSSDVKEELLRQVSTARHCQIAEIAAIISLCGKIISSEDEKYSIKASTDNVAVARKYFTLVKKTFKINTEVSIRQNTNLKKRRTYTLTVSNHEDSLRILQATKLIDLEMKIKKDLSLVDHLIIQQNCCKRAFIRGAFLAAGSISAPEKSYHFEIVCVTLEKALQLQEVIKAFEVDAKIVGRKKHFVVYIKEGTQIVEILNVMEAHVALMDLENIRILKDVRNTVNRKVNCETANISKTVSAAVKQIEDIQHIRDTIGLEELSEDLKETALARLGHPEATLKELGEMLNPAVGKSGINHRLRKLSDIANSFR